ncbi:MAG: response regulator [Candidatus Nanopelagicales bacterium]
MTTTTGSPTPTPAPAASAVTDPDVAATVARLERRAGRERASRLEAEAIAEAQLRRSYQHAREVELLAAIAVIVNESADLDATYGAAAKAIRRHCGFAVSHVLVPDDAGAFVSSDIWDADGDHLEFLDEVITATLDMTFVPPTGLPGQVAASHLAIWLPDLTAAGNFPRRDAISSGSAWAFPVVAGVEVVAVLEFLDPAPRPVDERLLTIAPSLAVQLGHAVEWERMRERENCDRRRLEDLVAAQTEALASAQREGAAAGAARAALLSHLAHEIAESSATLREGRTGEAATALLDRLDDASRRLLVVAEGAERRFTGERTSVRPAELLCDVLTRAGVGRDRSLSVSVSPGADVPLELNVPLVERVVATVVDNAVRHTSAGPTAVEIDRRDDELVIRVVDRGHGYTWDQNGSRPQGGSGLAQAARLATALGGSLTVTARPGGGTVAEARFAARNGAAPAPTGTGRILVVDDNTVNRRLAAAMLARAGFEADVVDSGEAALAALADQPYGLVLMDVQMPGMDGRETTRAWRRGDGGATPPEVPIVALTAHVGQDERDACAEAGMDDYLSKPFGIEALATMCRRWLQSSQAGSGAAR